MTYDWKEEWAKDLKYVKKNYSKEVEDYKKYFNKETFDKIIAKLEENKNYLIKFDDDYDDDNIFLGTTDIINKNNAYLKVCFKLFDFGSPDCKADMEKYLKGNLYSLDIVLVWDILPYEEIKENYEFIEEIKKQIDEVFKEIK